MLLTSGGAFLGLYSEYQAGSDKRDLTVSVWK
jgi:hypothetical protein